MSAPVRRDELGKDRHGKLFAPPGPRQAPFKHSPPMPRRLWKNEQVRSPLRLARQPPGASAFEDGKSSAVALKVGGKADYLRFQRPTGRPDRPPVKALRARSGPPDSLPCAWLGGLGRAVRLNMPGDRPWVAWRSSGKVERQPAARIGLQRGEPLARRHPRRRAKLALSTASGRRPAVGQGPSLDVRQARPQTPICAGPERKPSRQARRRGGLPGAKSWPVGSAKSDRFQSALKFRRCRFSRLQRRQSCNNIARIPGRQPARSLLRFHLKERAPASRSDPARALPWWRRGKCKGGARAGGRRNCLGSRADFHNLDKVPGPAAAARRHGSRSLLSGESAKGRALARQPGHGKSQRGDHRRAQNGKGAISNLANGVIQGRETSSVWLKNAASAFQRRFRRTAESDRFFSSLVGHLHHRPTASRATMISNSNRREIPMTGVPGTVDLPQSAPLTTRSRRRSPASSAVTRGDQGTVGQSELPARISPALVGDPSKAAAGSRPAAGKGRATQGRPGNTVKCGRPGAVDFP